MSAQHTPGPWNAVFYDRTAATEIWAGDTLIADVHSHVTTDNANADAILIAAAPELLASQTMGGQLNTPDFLDWIADRLVHVYGEPNGIDFVLSLRARAKAGRAAIAKATAEKA